MIHIDGAQSRMPKNSHFNNGNVQYELLIRSNTIISNLGYYEQTKIDKKPKATEISDVLHVTGRII